jgi:hypothetical protein
MNRIYKNLGYLENPVILSLTNQTFHDLETFLER